MSNAMRYQSEIQYDVRNVLCHVRDRGGKVPGSFVQAEYARLQGSRAAIVVNVALLALGKNIAYGNDGVTDEERSTLVERATQANQDVLIAIKDLREVK
jgi:hypothetical protein